MKNYRIHTIARIPTLKVLDFQKVKQKEREEAKKYLEFIENNNVNKIADNEKLDKKIFLKVTKKNLNFLFFYEFSYF